MRSAAGMMRAFLRISRRLFCNSVVVAVVLVWILEEFAGAISGVLVLASSSPCNFVEVGTLMQAEAVTVDRLRCEYAVNPLGIDVRRPRLSWVIRSGRRGEVQTAYQVLVASSEANLKANKGDLWDSGKVESDQSCHVVYAGKELGSRTRCFWKVRVWDRDGKPSAYSQPASWEMGLLEPDDWKAKWICFPPPLDASGKSEMGPSPYMRKSFSVDQRVAKARLYVTALGLYEVYLNGKRVGDHVFAPGWTDYNKRVMYQTYDVTNMLRIGENALGAVLGDGWYAGYVGLGGRNRYGAFPLLLCQLEIEYADGSSAVVVSDETWRASHGPILASDMLMGETYDARKEMPGWNKPGFDDSEWKPVTVKEVPNIKLVAQVGPPVRKTQELKAKSVSEPAPGRFVFDLGQNMVGWAKLKVHGEAGTQITLRFAEMLNPDGTIYTANYRSAKCTDTYILRGGGTEVYEPHFTFRGFRYVEVTGYPGKPPLDAVTGVVVHSDMPLTGRFECSKPMLNQLQSNIVWGQRGNYLSVPTDCPQRDERLGWTGDAQIFAKTAAFNMDVAGFFTKWLIDVEEAQTEDGAFPDVAPRVAVGVGTAAWGDAGVICPWTIYLCYGDKEVIERHYSAMAKWIDYLKSHSKELLRPDEGYGDWLSVNADTPRDVLATAYFAYSTRLLSKMARAVGRNEDAARYEELFQQIKEAFNKAYVAEDGRIKGNTQTCYVLALYFDLLPPEKRPLAVKYLVEDIQKRDWHLSTGFVGTAYLPAVLTEAGHLDVAYRLLNNDTFPSWGFTIKHGATTIWERWDGWTPEKGFQDPGMNSFNHYAFGSIGQWMYENILGINADEKAPGYKHIIIRPRPGGGITFAKGELESMYGRIASSWRLEDSRFRLSVAVPANTTATVYIPAASEQDVTERGKPASQAEGVKFLRMEDGAAVFEVGSGNYEFASKLPQGAEG